MDSPYGRFSGVYISRLNPVQQACADQRVEPRVCGRPQEVSAFLLERPRVSVGEWEASQLIG